MCVVTSTVHECSGSGDVVPDNGEPARPVPAEAQPARTPTGSPGSHGRGPPAAIRRSASRSAATAGVTSSSSAARQHLEGVVEDRRRARPGPLHVEAVQLVAHLDDAARVDEEVRGVGDPARPHPLGRPPCPSVTSWLFAPPHTTRARSTSTVWSSSAPPSALGLKTSTSSCSEVREVAHRPDGGVALEDRAHGIRVDVGDDDLGAVLEQVLGQAAADLADPGDGDPAAAQARVAPHVLRRRAHALEDAVGGEHRGVTGAARARASARWPSGWTPRRRPCRRRRCRRRRP